MKIITMKVGPLPTNCYIVLDEKGNAAVIDPGGEGASILNRISQENATLSMVLLTHAHFDHIYGLPELGNPTLFLHKEDIPMLTDEEKNLSKAFGLSISGSMPTPTPISDGDQIPFGDDAFTVLHTPGHTRGGCAFLIHSFLFSGDTLFAGEIGRMDCYGGNPADMRKSLERLYLLPGEYQILPGHGPSSTLSREKKENPYLSSFGNCGI